ncbi:uncharacterized protein G2W53_041897 [Senna tora]|uniref:Uncharacterized protein n=1 Tax=Senna tora TaxID=362788 RepID=A0A834SFY4_9FABA|nr:uncharacterized protein G2W53_041897 [Senna tora]
MLEMAMTKRFDYKASFDYMEAVEVWEGLQAAKEMSCTCVALESDSQRGYNKDGRT